MTNGGNYSDNKRTNCDSVLYLKKIKDVKVQGFRPTQPYTVRSL